jgi:ribose-phosphate pyrophosphokinase
MLLFSLDHDGVLAPAIAADLDLSLAPHQDRAFEDGEYKLRPLVDPRGTDAYVIHSLHGGPRHSPNDKLMRLLMFCATLRDHGADRVTAVVPYLTYAREDRQTKPYDAVTLRHVAQLIEAVGVVQLIALEVHNVAAFQNAFRIPTIHLEAHRVFDTVLPEIAGNAKVAVASPDPGGVKRAQLWRESLEKRLARPVGFAMVDKRRNDGAVTSENLVAGDVSGMRVLLIDDLIATGDTLRRAALALRQAGASEVIACAAHGLFLGAAADLLADEVIDRVVLTDSVPPFRLSAQSEVRNKLRIVSAAGVFAQAIRECQESRLL